MHAAKRELREECGLSSSEVAFASAPFTVTDVITPEPGTPEQGSAFHYVLAQTFCRTRAAVAPEQLRAGDDAGDARWCTLDELQQLQGAGETVPGVVQVVARALELDASGLLPVEGGDA